MFSRRSFLLGAAISPLLPKSKTFDFRTVRPVGTPISRLNIIAAGSGGRSVFQAQSRVFRYPGNPRPVVWFDITAESTGRLKLDDLISAKRLIREWHNDDDTKIPADRLDDDAAYSSGERTGEQSVARLGSINDATDQRQIPEPIDIA